MGWPARSHEAVLRLRDLSLRVDTSRAELFPYWEIWHERVYDSIPGFCCTGPKCVVDVGANIGAFSLYQSLKKKADLVVAFEPSSASFRRLTDNIKLNSVHNIQAINAAVGASCGTLPFVELPFSFNCRIARSGDQSIVTVLSVTLDSALGRLGIKKIDLLKIDTEGYEAQVLEGASAILKRTDRVVLEMHSESDRDQFDARLFLAGLRFIGRVGDLLFYSRS